jgi:serine/threonine protein kinase
MNVVSSAPLPPAPLQRFGKYVLVEQIALGGMAEVFLAVEEMPQAGRRFVILKRIRPSFETDSDYVEYFLTEARVALKVAHPNLPQAFELGHVDDVYYLSMELIRGPTLLDLLRRARAADQMLSIESCVLIGRSIAAALEHTPRLRDVAGAPLCVIHRDVTPQNILIAYEGAIKLIDFGIARAAIQTHKTDTGVVKGKFSYLAPEQIHRRATVDHRADIFSLGIVLHEALIGRPLFRGNTDRETIERVQRAPIPSPSQLRSDVPEAVSAVVLRALERDPDKRYPTALEMLADLERAGETCGIPGSVLPLRAEVHRFCGPPGTYELPTLAALPSLVSTAADVKLTEARARRARSVHPEEHVPPAPSRRVGLDADEDLLYFLRQAGAILPENRPRRLKTTASDADFVALLASLER